MTGILTACAQSPKMMYNWESYQPQVYNYLNEESKSDHATQAQLLEQNIETARSADQTLPPGFYAHLGMLYLKLGKAAEAVEQLQNEKRAFPEATPFIEFLLRNFGAPDTQSATTLPDSDAGVAQRTISTTVTPAAKQEPKKGA